MVDLRNRDADAESSRRLAEITVHAVSVFGDPEKAAAWLRRPQERLEGAAPVDLLGTEDGVERVREALLQIDEGYWA